MGSDLGRLYYYARGDGSPQQAKENFTTEALAIAIGDDPSPMLAALRGVVWGAEGSPVAPEVDGIDAHTQVYVPPDHGYQHSFLDLVLDLTASRATVATVWVEVKIDAPESGKQLEKYECHRLRRERTWLLTLSREPLREWVPCLPWH